MKQLFFLVIFAPVMCLAQHMGSVKLELKGMPQLPPEDFSIGGFLNSFPEVQNLNVEEKTWFYWTNYSRINPRRFWDSVVQPLLTIYPQFRGPNSVSLRNDLYSTGPLPLLRPSTTLAKLAQEQASALARRRSGPSHSSPDGASFQMRMEKGNVKACAGENISFGPANTIFSLVLLYLDPGVSDLGHRKSLLNPSYVEMGIGISNYPNDMKMVVQDFSCLQQ